VNAKFTLLCVLCVVGTLNAAHAAGAEADQRCAAGRARATALLTQMTPQIPASIRAAGEEHAAKPSRGLTPADAWDQFAGMAYLSYEPAIALWAELTALKLDWRPEYAANAGVYLVKLNELSDAKLLLHCALAMGYRSPYLFEALAMAYQASGEKAEAVKHIQSAAAEAPDDPLIQAEVSLLTTGKPPAPPKPESADALDRAVRELERHFEAVQAVLKRHDELSRLIEQIHEYDLDKNADPQVLAAKRRAKYRGYLDSLRPALASARLTPADVKRQFPHMTDELARQYLATARSGAFYLIVDFYFIATDELLLQSRSVRFEELFWADVLRMDVLARAREIHDARKHDYRGSFVIGADRYGTNGETLDAPGLIAAAVLSNEANDKRSESHRACGQQFGNAPEKEKACRLKVDVQYCKVLVPHYYQWANYAKARYFLAARNYGHVAGKWLAWGSEQALDARQYAVRTLKAVPAASDGLTQKIQADHLARLNQRYRRLVSHAGGGSEEPERRSPAWIVAEGASWFARDRSNQEQQLVAAEAELVRLCGAVEQRRLEQLAEEHAKAVRDMLLDRLKGDVNAKWDPTASCSLGFGPGLSMTAYDSGKVSFSGKLKDLLAGSLSDGKDVNTGKPTDPYRVRAGFKATVVPGESIGGAFNVSGSGSYGPFNGKSDIGWVAQYDVQRQSWDNHAQIKGALGMGLKVGGVGATCYPGEFSMKFHPRTVMKDAGAYVRSLQPQG